MLLHLLNRKGAQQTNKITQLVHRLFYTKLGQIMISMLFGLAFAFIFQKACKDKKCVTIESPPMAEIKQTTYRIGNKCYNYVPRMIACEEDA